MTDNVTANLGSGGATFATDARTISGGTEHWPITKVAFGTRDTAYTIVDSSNGLPVAISAPVAVTGTFWQTTQPVSGTVSVSGSVPVTGAFFQATQPVSAASLPLPSGAAADGTDGTGITVPTGGSGIRGWLSGIYQKLSGTIATSISGSVAVTGTFFQATQPVSIATMPSTPVTGTFWQTTQPVSTPAPLVVAGSTLTRPANTTAYTFGALVAQSTTAASCVGLSTGSIARAINTNGTILRCRLDKSGTTITNAIFRIHLYSSLPTFTNGDGGAFLTTSSGWLGSFDVTVNEAFSAGSSGVGVPTSGYGVNFAPASGAQNLYYVIEARAAYTPSSAETFTPTFEVQ